MPSKDIERKTQDEWKFTRSLNEARKRIDLNTHAGKVLDKALYPLYKKYGYYDSRVKMTGMNMTKASNADVAFFNQDNEKMLSDLGINMNFYKDIALDGHSKFTEAYIRASEALREVKKKLTFEKYNSGNYAWDIYGILHWVTDFANMLNQVETEKHESIQRKKKEITESLQRLIYHAPKKTSEHVEIIAKNYNTHRDYVIESFKENVGQTPMEYTELLLNEALGDYVKYKGTKLGQQIKSKLGTGQSKAIAKAKLKNMEAMNTMLTGWNERVLGNPKAATPALLRAYLLNTLKTEPHVVDDIINKFFKDKKFLNVKTDKPVGRKTTESKEQVKEASPRKKMDLEKDVYLPQNQLRDFFLDVVAANRIAQMGGSGKVATNVAPKAAAVTLPAKPFTQPIGATTAATPTTPQTPTAPVQSQPAPAPQKAHTPADVASIVKTLPANQRAKAILDALPSLSDDEVKQILSGLVARKP